MNEKFKPKKLLHFIAFFMLFSCDKKDTVDDTPPILSTAPLDLSKVTSIIPFGENLSASQKNPAFEYITNSADVNVKSVSEGYIEAIKTNQGFDDVEIWVKPNPNSPWLIIYDHILVPNVSIGDTILPGDILGKVGESNRTELQLNNNELAHCPLNFGTTAFIEKHLNISENWCLKDIVVP